MLTFTVAAMQMVRPAKAIAQLKLDGNELWRAGCRRGGRGAVYVVRRRYGHWQPYGVCRVPDLKTRRPKVTSELAITVNKIDLSDLLITNVPTNTSVYYRGGKKAQWYYITVSYDPENWPEGFAFSQSNLNDHRVLERAMGWQFRRTTDSKICYGFINGSYLRRESGICLRAEGGD